jgi:hypothetical protein
MKNVLALQRLTPKAGSPNAARPPGSRASRRCGSTLSLLLC